MKKYLMMLCVCLCASGSFAGTSVAWYFGWGMYPNGAGSVTDQTPGTGVAAVNSVIWQLVWAGGDSTIGAVDSGNSGFGYVTGDDQVLATRTVAAGGGTIGADNFDQWLFCNPDTVPTAVYESSTAYSVVYMRVFQDTTPAIGEWYYDTTGFTTANVDISGAHTTDTFDGNPNSGSNQGNALNVQIVAVPEPSTVGLLLCGIGLIAARRFRKA